MLLPRALLVPHWPTLLEDELRRHRTPMLEALALEARRFRAERPEIVGVLSARWESSGPFHVGSGRLHRTLTDDPGFGVESRYDCTGHPELARALVQAGAAAGVRVGPSERGVDGGITVPMHFLVPGGGIRVVPLSTALRPVEECRHWGAAIRGVVAMRPERIGLVVGGMLSHATHAWNFRREVPEAGQLDQAVLEALRAGDWDAIGPAADKWKTKAHPEASLRHLEVLRGFLGADVPGEVRSYESGPGVGTALVAFPVPGGVSVATPEDLAEVPVARIERPARRPYAPRPERGTRPPRDSRRDGRQPPRDGERRRPAGSQGPRATVGSRKFGGERGTGGKFRGSSRTGGKLGGGSRTGGKFGGSGRTDGKIGGERRTGGKFGGRTGRTSGKFGGGRTSGGKVGRGPAGSGRPGGRGRPSVPSRGASAGSRTPRARGRAPTSRPARRPRG
jgi:aromatic ring-opening dioxygenase catalytic subunit (LigB family)